GPGAGTETGKDPGFAWTVLTQGVGAIERYHPGVWARDSCIWGLSWAPMHRPHVRGERGGELSDDAWKDVDGEAQREGPFRRDAESVRRDAVSFAGDPTRFDAGLPGNYGGN